MGLVGAVPNQFLQLGNFNNDILSELECQPLADHSGNPWIHDTSPKGASCSSSVHAQIRHMSKHALDGDHQTRRV